MTSPRAAGPGRVRVSVEAVAWMARALGHRAPGRLTLEKTLAPGATVADLLGDLAREHPDFADYALADDGSLACPHVCVTLNGAVLAIPTDLGRHLRDGDVVVILPAFAGG